MLEKEFVKYNEALALKELGFDEPCFGYYDGNHNLQYMYNGKPEKFTEKRMGVSDSKWVGWISAPTYSQAFRWFRGKHKLYHEIKMFGDWDNPQYSYIVSGTTRDNPVHMFHYENMQIV